jgi:hypothetical protein
MVIGDARGSRAVAHGPPRDNFGRSYVAIMADASITRARQALKHLGGRRASERICLVCGLPLGQGASIRLHGDTFHERCAGYRTGSQPES